MDSTGSVVFLIDYPVASRLREKRQEESKMKKWRIGVAVAVLAATLVGSTTAYASGYGGHHRWYVGNYGSASTVSCPRESGCWRDTDGDGICDLCGGLGYGYEDADGDGICDHYGICQSGGGCHGGRHCQW